MAYWRLRRTFTVPDVLGFALASSGNPGIDGDYYRTSQTCNNAPVFLRAAAGGAPAMYLFLAYDSQWTAEAAWYLASEVHQYMSEELDEDPWISYYPYSGCRSMMDYYDVDVTRPDAAMLSGTWSRNDGQTGSYSATASELLDTASPLLDASGTDGFGHVRRFPSSLDIPREGLVFDAQFTHEISRAATGQALTFDVSVPTGEPASPWRADVGGLPCIRTYYRYHESGKVGIAFPDSALNGGRLPLSVSAWLYLQATSSYMHADWFYIGDASNYLNFGVNDHDLCVHGQSPGGQIENGKWCHVVYSFTGRSIIAFLNGAFAGTCVCDVDVKKTGTASIAQNVHDPDGTWGGFLAGIRVYNRVLSEAEIQRLYNEHKEVVP